MTGGGTGGSVTPLLGLADYLIKTENLSKDNFIWIGSNTGLEKNLVEQFGIRYFGISSGKLRRYFSIRNFIDPFLIKFGFFQSLFFLKREQPALIISAGSFIAVPAVIAGWCLRIPSLVHQMDVRPGLANKLMAPFAKIITVTFEKSLHDYGAKALLVGNIVREEIKKAKDLNRDELAKNYKLDPALPIVLVVGGGTGAEAINALILNNLSLLTSFCQILHIMGEGKDRGQETINYRIFDFLSADKLAECYALADLVISRAGLGFISELSFLSKPSIIIPIPDSHQEDNAKLLAESEAAFTLDQNTVTDKQFLITVQEILNDKKILKRFSQNIHLLINTEAEAKMTAIIKNII